MAGRARVLARIMHCVHEFSSCILHSTMHPCLYNAVPVSCHDASISLRASAAMQQAQSVRGLQQAAKHAAVISAHDPGVALGYEHLCLLVKAADLVIDDAPGVRHDGIVVPCKGVVASSGGCKGVANDLNAACGVEASLNVIGCQGSHCSSKRVACKVYPERCFAFADTDAATQLCYSIASITQTYSTGAAQQSVKCAEEILTGASTSL